MIAPHVHERNSDPCRERPFERCRKLLDDDDHGGRGSGVRIVGEPADAARKQNADVRLTQRRHEGRMSRHGLADPVSHLAITERDRQRHETSRAAQPRHVFRKQERHPVVGAEGFVDTLPVEKPVVEDRDDGILGLRNDPIDVDDTRQCTHGCAYSTLGPAGMRVLNAAQMREADRRTSEELGLPSIVLMENAGRQVITAIEATFDDALSLEYAVLCGKGQNGGDGFVVARGLLERGIAVRVYLVGRREDVRGDARTNLALLTNQSIDVIELGDATDWELHAPAVLSANVIVDAIVGTGLNAPISGLVATIVEDLNASDTPVVSIDLPSGLDAASSAVHGPTVSATLTVALGAPKIPHVLPPAEHHVGHLVVADIGIPQSLIDDGDGPRLEVLTPARMRLHVTPRAAESQKGDYGRVLVVAGSNGKTGAAWLAAMAALRSGAGLVTVATPRSCQLVLSSLGVEYMTLGLEETADGCIAYEAADVVADIDADVVVLGPGLGRGPSTSAFVQAVVERAGTPVVLDADALFAFGEDPDRLRGREDVPVVITPHPGEMARLLGTSVDDVQSRRLEVARDFAAARHLHVVLKGHRTLVASPDGSVGINMTGNPGMATGGTGDVLAGMVGAWCAQLLDPTAACQLAVYLHGLAGDLAAADEGEVALIAGDLITRLGAAVKELTDTQTPA